MLNDGLFALVDEHVGFGQAAFLDHLIAVMEMRGVLVARVGSEGESPADAICRDNEVLVRDVRHLVNFDGDVSGPREIDDALGALASPNLPILPSDGNREKCGLPEDVDGLGGEQLFDELHVGGHEFLAIVHHGVNLPDRQPAAFGTRQRERIPSERSPIDSRRFSFRPAGLNGLQTNANEIMA